MVRSSVLVLIFFLIPIASIAGRRIPDDPNSSFALRMVYDYNSNGFPTWGDTLTYDVYTTSTPNCVNVSTRCYRDGVLIAARDAVVDSKGGACLWDPWPWTINMTLETSLWTSGPADCIGTMYISTARKDYILKVLKFHVDP